MIWGEFAQSHLRSYQLEATSWHGDRFSAWSFQAEDSITSTIQLVIKKLCCMTFKTKT